MKKSLLKEILISVLTLGLISLISGGILGLVSHFTYIDENEQISRVVDKIYSTGVYDGDEELSLLSLEGFNKEYDRGSIVNVFVGGETYIIHAIGSGGYDEDFQILISIENNVITSIACYSSGETPGVGSRVFNEETIKSYCNKDISGMKEFVLSKDPQSSEEIQTVTGATKSSTALVNAVNVAVDWYKSREVLNEECRNN